MIRLRTTALCAVLLVGPSVASAQSSEVRIGVLGLATGQNVLGASGLNHSSGTVAGAEFLARSQAAGVYARYLTGTIGDLSARGPDGGLREAEARLMLGPTVLSVEGGYVLRARAGSLAKPRDELVRGGVRSTVWLGPSGFSLSLTAGAYARSDSSGGAKKLKLVGWEAVTALLYQTPKLPFYAMLGYRYERLRTEEQFPPVQREELSAIVLGFGLRHISHGGSKAQPAP